jgi:Cu+-exporting ATPase
MPPPNERSVDPVCGMTVDPTSATEQRILNDDRFWFCGADCAQQFDEHPSRFNRST